MVSVFKYNFKIIFYNTVSKCKIIIQISFNYWSPVQKNKYLKKMGKI